MAGVETQRESRVGKACCEGTQRGQTCADVSKEAGPGTQGAPFQLSEGTDLPNPFIWDWWSPKLWETHFCLGLRHLVCGIL